MRRAIKFVWHGIHSRSNPLQSRLAKHEAMDLIAPWTDYSTKRSNQTAPKVYYLLSRKQWKYTPCDFVILMDLTMLGLIKIHLSPVYRRYRRQTPCQPLSLWPLYKKEACRLTAWAQMVRCATKHAIRPLQHEAHDIKWKQHLQQGI